MLTLERNTPGRCRPTFSKQAPVSRKWNRGRVYRVGGILRATRITTFQSKKGFCVLRRVSRYVLLELHESAGPARGPAGAAFAPFVRRPERLKWSGGLRWRGCHTGGIALLPSPDRRRFRPFRLRSAVYKVTTFPRRRFSIGTRRRFSREKATNLA